METVPVLRMSGYHLSKWFRPWMSGYHSSKWFRPYLFSFYILQTGRVSRDITLTELTWTYQGLSSYSVHFIRLHVEVIQVHVNTCIHLVVILLSFISLFLLFVFLYHFKRFKFLQLEKIWLYYCCSVKSLFHTCTLHTVNVHFVYMNGCWVGRSSVS